MDWQTLQYPTFPVLWCSIPHNDRPAPLQIRSFTSDSYRVIKERGRKKGCRRKGINTEQRSSVRDKESMGASAQAEAMLQIARIKSVPHDVKSASDSEDSERDLLAIQDDGKTQLDGAGSIIPFEGPSSCGFRCLTSPPSSAMYSNVRLDSEVFTGSEHE